MDLIRRIFLPFLFIIQEINGFACPPNYQPYENAPKCFRIVLQNVQKRSSAQRDCEVDDGMLASITSEDEMNFIVLEMEQMTSGYTGKLWIGLISDDSTGPFAWEDGAQPIYTRWATGEPAGNNKCATIIPQNEYYWFITKCSERYDYVCQWPSRTEIITSLPSTTQVPFAGESLTTDNLASANAPTPRTTSGDTTAMISVSSTNANPTSIATMTQDSSLSVSQTDAPTETTTENSSTDENASASVSNVSSFFTTSGKGTTNSNPSADVSNVSPSLTTNEDGTTNGNSSVGVPNVSPSLTTYGKDTTDVNASLIAAENSTKGVMSYVGSTNIEMKSPVPPIEVSITNADFVISGVFNTDVNGPMTFAKTPSSSGTEISDQKGKSTVGVFVSMLSTDMTSDTLSSAYRTLLSSVTDGAPLTTKTTDKERHRISTTSVLINREQTFNPTIHEAPGAAVIGILGIVALCCIFACVVISDLRALAEDFRDMLQNIGILEKEKDTLKKYSYV